MGILNLTPDSFYDGGRFPGIKEQILRAEAMLNDGARIIDMGAVSTRPGADVVTESDEIERLIPAIRAVSKQFPECIISADTFRPVVARAAVENGASMINDVYGSRFSTGMLETVAKLKVPYILMHMKGTPVSMQIDPVYSDVVAEVTYFFENTLKLCREAGVEQVIIDPGFGFGKTVAHNFELLARLDEFKSLEKPILAGLSRKSMICRSLGIKPPEALNGTTVLNTIALLKGADILRAHDVREAVEAVSLVGMMG
jgi:dihydropteroate synthase